MRSATSFAFAFWLLLLPIAEHVSPQCFLGQLGGTLIIRPPDASARRAIANHRGQLADAEVPPTVRADARLLTEAAKPQRGIGSEVSQGDDGLPTVLPGRLPADRVPSAFMFPEEVVRKRWEEAGGSCPCRAGECRTHAEDSPCGNGLEWDQRDKRPHTEYRGAWFAYQLASGAEWGEENCKVICLNCHLALK